MYKTQMEKQNQVNKTFEGDSTPKINVSDNSSSPSFFNELHVSDCKRTLSPLQVILSLCRVKNWHLSDLASEVGIARQSLNHYLHGRWTIPSMIKIKIAQALNVDSSVIWDLGK